MPPVTIIYLPCPFCGGFQTTVEATLRDGCKPGDFEAYAYSVRCLSCAATGGWAKSEAGALRCWTMRVKPYAK
jgi:hypothetical protein